MGPEMLAATSLGVLTGYLVGLSASPVVAAVVSALIAMAAGVTALGGASNLLMKDDDATGPRGRRHDYAAFAFALAAVAGVTAGIWVRSHNLLSPAPSVLQAQWQALGFDQETAARIALISLTGIAMEQEGASKLAAPDGVRASTLLFSETGSDACQRTDPARAPDADEARRAWRLAPGDWPDLAVAMKDADLEGLKLLWSLSCAERER